MNKSAKNKLPPLLPQEIIDRAGRLEAALLSDGMKGTDIPGEGTMNAEIMPVSTSMRVVGTAMTVTACDGDNLPIHVATYTTPPGYVMVIDGRKFERKAYVGDLIAQAAQAAGFRGIIIDGYVRDREGLTTLGFPVFSRGFMQAGPVKETMQEINGTIHCAGVVVSPGDLVLGDGDGVTVVPRNRIEEILEKAEAKQRMDQAMEANIKAYNQAVAQGKTPPSLMPKWVEELLAQQG